MQLFWAVIRRPRDHRTDSFHHLLVIRTTLQGANVHKPGAEAEKGGHHDGPSQNKPGIPGKHTGGASKWNHRKPEKDLAKVIGMARVVPKAPTICTPITVFAGQVKPAKLFISYKQDRHRRQGGYHAQDVQGVGKQAVTTDFLPTRGQRGRRRNTQVQWEKGACPGLKLASRVVESGAFARSANPRGSIRCASRSTCKRYGNG